MIKKVLILSGSLLFLFGCAAKFATMKLTPDQKLYTEQMMAFPLEFEMSKTAAVDVWGRAQSFIGKYSSMKLQTATDFIIQTYNPGEYEVSYGYYVTKTPLGEKVQFTVVCNTGNMYRAQSATANAHILAYYMATGKLPYPEMIER